MAIAAPLSPGEESVVEYCSLDVEATHKTYAEQFAPLRTDSEYYPKSVNRCN